MSMSSDPKRSFEDAELPDALRSALAAARADGPSVESVSRVAERLGVAGPGAASAKAAASAGRSKLVMIAALCVLGGAGMHAAFTNDHAAIAPVPERTAQEPQASPALVVRHEPPSSVRAQALEASEPAAAPRRTQAVLPAKSRAHAPGVVPAAHLDPNAELELLRRAQAALTPAPSRALVLCEQHARLFPRGAFQQERELIAVVALANRGDLRAARARAERFERAYPDSVHEPRLKALLADHKSGEPGARTGKPAESRPSTGD